VELDELAVLEERGAVSAGRQRGVALAWLADRAPCRDRSGLWLTGGGPAGRLEGLMARRPVICCGLLAYRVGARWPGPRVRGPRVR